MTVGVKEGWVEGGKVDERMDGWRYGKKRRYVCERELDEEINGRQEEERRMKEMCVDM